MKRLIKFATRSFCMLLALVTCFSVSACNKNKVIKGEDIYNYVDTSTYPENTEGLHDLGVHDYTAPIVEGKWIVKNSHTDYKVVVPATTVRASKAYFNYMVNEFVYFFEKATGIVPEVVKDSALPVQEHKADQKYISIGHTSLLKSLDSVLEAKVEEKFAADYAATITDEQAIIAKKNEIRTALSPEYKIDYKNSELYNKIGGSVDSVDDNIYITGFIDEGSTSAVYTFLQIVFNYKTYTANTYKIDKNVTDVPFRDFEVLDIPDAMYIPTTNYERTWFNRFGEWTKVYNHPTYDANMYGVRTRTIQDYRDTPTYEIFDDSYATPEEAYEGNAVLNAYGGKGLSTVSGHNNLDLVAPAKWSPLHPTWIAAGNVQLCYTCQGEQNEENEEFEALTQKLADAYCYAFMLAPTEEYPLNDKVQLSNIDSPNVCTCDSCETLKVRYGGHGGVMLMFENRVAEKIDAWMDKQEGKPWYRPDWKLTIPAYTSTMAPPTRYNPITEQYETLAEEIYMHENIEVVWAPNTICFTQSIFSETNAVGKEQMGGWSWLAEGRMNHYNYLCYTRTPEYFMDTTNFTSTRSMNEMLYIGGSYWYSEQFHGDTPSEWGALQCFLTSSLSYNSQQDSGKLIKDYFDNVFGPAANVMYSYFINQRIFYHDQAIANEMYSVDTNGHGINYSHAWSVNLLKAWIGQIDEAHAAIAYLKDIDPVEFERISENIELEAHALMRIMLSNDKTKDKLTSAEKNSYINRIKNNLSRFPRYELVSGGFQMSVQMLLAQFS